MHKLFLFFFSIISAASIGAVAQDGRPVVLELFTSQGCSSCPPADRLVGDLSKRDDILALSFHVDYWNYIGWKDPYSKPEYTQHQKDYGKALGLRGAYTPQVVIQGKYEAVGSNASKVARAIALAKTSIGLAKEGDVWVDAKISRNADKVSISLPETADVDAELFLVEFKKYVENDVSRGENSGRKLTHHNVVLEKRSLGKWNGEPRELSEAVTKGDGVAILVQKPRNGNILGAGWL